VNAVILPKLRVRSQSAPKRPPAPLFTGGRWLWYGTSFPGKARGLAECPGRQPEVHPVSPAVAFTYRNRQGGRFVRLSPHPFSACELVMPCGTTYATS